MKNQSNDNKRKSCNSNFLKQLEASYAVIIVIFIKWHAEITKHLFIVLMYKDNLSVVFDVKEIDPHMLVKISNFKPLIEKACKAEAW